MNKESNFYETKKGEEKRYFTVKNNIIGSFGEDVMKVFLKNLEDIKKLKNFDYLVEIKTFKKTKKEEFKAEFRRIFFGGQLISKENALIELLDNDEEYHKVFNYASEEIMLSYTRKAFEYNKKTDVIIDLEKMEDSNLN